MGRTPCCEKEGLRRGRWTAEEDDKLKKYIEANGEGSWRSLPKNAGLLRCGKSCRLRWINYLRTDLKRGNISPQEDETILKLHTTLGNRWSLIAGHLPGRTDNEIKNYWNSHLSKKIYSDTKKDSPQKPTTSKRGRPNNKQQTVIAKKKKKKTIPSEESCQSNSIPETTTTNKPKEEEEEHATTSSSSEKEPSKNDHNNKNSTTKDPKIEEEHWDFTTDDGEKLEKEVISTIIESGEWFYSAWPSSNFNNEWMNWDWESDGVLGQNVQEQPSSWFWANNSNDNNTNGGEECR
ncbi:transcription factor MYB111 [Cucumis sativus]|uniref:transcription factor MYB111 n=1 Tax=Cucumis sativus TaxID=3659 RepID=UPI0002B482AE|nr:transcription factor MYB111 [Cucumis sativus]KAE8647085.1 hypothetical protein Csa_023037 [Cucumis sativus]